MRILFDDEAFVRHERSGVSRYLTELVRTFRAHPALNVDAVTPYRFVANRHLTESLPSDYTYVPLPRRLRAGTLRRLNGLGGRAREGRIDVVHHALYEPWRDDRWPGAAHAVVVYDLSIELHPWLFEEWARSGIADKRRAMERSDVLICISETTRDDLRRVYPDIDKPVVVTPLGVGERFSRPGPPVAGLPSRYLLHVGSRFEHKNADLIYQALALLRRSQPDLHLVVSGNPLSAAERRRLAELGVADRVVRVKASDDELPRLYANAQAFVFPSSYEGFGLPVVEAMAAGCPVAIASTPVLLEVAEGASVVFDHNDPGGCAEAIERLTADGAMRTRLAQRGRERAARYSWRRTAELTASAYDDVRRYV